MKKTRLLILFCLIGLGLPSASFAYAWRTGNSVNVAAGETLEGNFYAAAENIAIDGDINGDIFLAGQNIAINGRILGDVFAAGENITVNGEVGSSLRVIGARVDINGQVAHSAMGLGADINLAKEATVGWDMLFAGLAGNFLGKIGLDLHGGGAFANIAGAVGRDVKLRLDRQLPSQDGKSGLIVADSARINGNLYYTAPAQGDISENAKIGGEIGYRPVKYRTRERQIWNFAWGGLFSIFSLYVVGLVMVSLWRKQIKGINKLMAEKAVASFGIGALIMVLTPIAAVFLLFTMIGIPLALILIAAWLAALYSAKILAGIFIGRNLLERFSEKRKESMIYAMIIGVFIAWLAGSLPFLGWIFSIILVWWSLGGAWIYFKK